MSAVDPQRTDFRRDCGAAGHCNRAVTVVDHNPAHWLHLLLHRAAGVPAGGPVPPGPLAFFLEWRRRWLRGKHSLTSPPRRAVVGIRLRLLALRRRHQLVDHEVLAVRMVAQMGQCRIDTRVPLITVRCDFSIPSIAHPASTQSQCMGQLVEPGSGLPHDLGLLRPDELAPSYCLPSNVLVYRIVNTALHRPAPCALPVSKNRLSVSQHRRNVSCPLMCEYAPHGCPPRAYQRNYMGQATPTVGAFACPLPPEIGGRKCPYPLADSVPRTPLRLSTIGDSPFARHPCAEHATPPAIAEMCPPNALEV